MKGFNYVLSKKEKERIAFGSTIERNVLPLRSVGGSKFTSHFTREIIPKVDPAKYDSNNAFKKLNEKITNKRGVCSLIYTAPRLKYSYTTTPFLKHNLPRYPPKVKCNKYPFSSSMPRFRASGNSIPGVGYYDILSAGKRKLKFRHSLGGSTVLVTGTDIKCVPENLDICHKCEGKPKGDYWHLENKTFLCRKCKENEDEKPTLFNKFALKKFRRLRDCSFMHEHGGTVAALILIDKYECQQLPKYEAYFGLYFKSRRGYSLNEGPYSILPWPLKRYGRPREKSKLLFSDTIQ